MFGSLLSAVSGHYEYETFFALQNISFHIDAGECVGILGRNGSGKSTLLKILANVYRPTSGTAVCNNLVYPMLELGVGFQPDFTVRHNISIYGALLGFQRQEMLAKIESVLEFSGLSRFADAKLETLSSGMQMRLGFAIAIQSIAPIMLVDEVLAVGDQQFQDKCNGIFQGLVKGGSTVVLVSHNVAAIQQLCTRVLVIDQGQLKFDGNVNEGCDYYLNTVLAAPR